jgi:hypothetical protein
VDQGWRDWQLNCLISPANVGAKGFRKFGADQFYGLHSWQVRQNFNSQPQLLATLDGSFVRQNWTSLKRDARPELVQCIHCNGSQFRSAVLHRSATLASGVPLSCCRRDECFGGHMAKIIEFYIPQSFRKVSPWLPPAERGKVLAFPMAVRKSA